MKSTKRFVITSSSGESGIEDFGWVENNELEKNSKLDYLKYPLKKWNEIVYEQDLEKSEIREEGKYYEYIVNKIMEKDIFKDSDFHKEKNSIFDFVFKDNYKIDYTLLKKGNIIPDFFVHKITIEKFLRILEERKYMMIFLKNNIPKDKKFISIVGEIKTSRFHAHKIDNQRQDYLAFINSVNTLNNSSNSDEFLVMMYIYDFSFASFKKEEKDYNVDTEPIIYGYMPKFYREDCYKCYNDIIDQLKLPNNKKIDSIDKTKFRQRKSKREIENENKKLLEKNKKLERLLYLLFAIIIIFVAIILKILKNKIYKFIKIYQLN